MEAGPLANQLTSSRGGYLAFENLAVECHQRVLTRVFRVKMRRRMIIEVHANDDTEESRDDRHGGIVAVRGEGKQLGFHGYGRCQVSPYRKLARSPALTVGSSAPPAGVRRLTILPWRRGRATDASGGSSDLEPRVRYIFVRL